MKSPVAAALFGWLLPGAGHFYIGQRGKAACFFIVLTLMFTAGLLLTGGGVLNPGRHPLALIVQVLQGVPALIGLVITRGAVEPPGSVISDLGMLLTLCAGALNVLVISDALYKAAPEPETKT